MTQRWFHEFPHEIEPSVEARLSAFRRALFTFQPHEIVPALFDYFAAALEHVPDPDLDAKLAELGARFAEGVATARRFRRASAMLIVTPTTPEPSPARTSPMP